MTDSEITAPSPPAARRRKAVRRPAAEAQTQAQTQTQTQGEAQARLLLPADAGIDTVSALQAEALPLIAAPALTVDASAVQRLHTATLQLLAALVRDRRRAGQSTDWHQPTAVVHASARALGLTSLLELPPELP